MMRAKSPLAQQTLAGIPSSVFGVLAMIWPVMITLFLGAPAAPIVWSRTRHDGVAIHNRE